jgi:hypothetical protein
VLRAARYRVTDRSFSAFLALPPMPVIAFFGSRSPSESAYLVAAFGCF